MSQGPLKNFVPLAQAGQPPIPPPEPWQKNQVLKESFRTVGETLMVLEAACMQVGIPWLAPLKRVRGLRKRFEAPMDDYLRYSLVTVSSKHLEMYRQDLLNARDSGTSCPALAIRDLGPIERYGFVLLIPLLLFAVCASGSLLYGARLHEAIISSVFAALGAGVGALSLCLETSRRTSFLRIIDRELSRRRGKMDSQSRTLQLIPIDGSTVPE